MSYIEFMRTIARIVRWEEWGTENTFEEFIDYIRGTAYSYGIVLNSDLEVIQLIEIAKKYEVIHL